MLEVTHFIDYECISFQSFDRPYRSDELLPLEASRMGRSEALANLLCGAL